MSTVQGLKIRHISDIPQETLRISHIPQLYIFLKSIVYKIEGYKRIVYEI
jgi:hypothetical protein